MEQASKSASAAKKTSSVFEEQEIYMVRVYQSVNFCKKQETYFMTKGRNGTPSVKIEVLENLSMVRISNESDDIVVPFTNVSCIYLRSKIREKNEAEAEKIKNQKVGVDAKEIKRPR